MRPTVPQAQLNPSLARRIELETQNARVAAGDVLPVAIFTNSVVMGGLEEHVLQLARGLRARGFPVGVICSRHDAVRPLREGLASVDVEVYALASRRASLLGALPRTLSLARILRRYAGGILHLHFTGHTGGDLVTLAARLSGVGAVVRSVHVPPLTPVGPRDRLLLRIRDRQLAKIICVSEQTRREHLAALGRDEQKCTVVHNGVDLRRFSPDVTPLDVRKEFGLDHHAPVIGTVSRLGETRKGIDHFLDAVPPIAARYPAARFLIVGDGPLRPDLERKAEALGVADKVVFTGHRDDVPALLAAMRVFASPSLFEACQYNLLEAMAMGLPVVSTPAGVAPEVVEDGVTGRLVPLADSASLARAVLELLDGPMRAAAMGQRARQVIASRFSVDAMIDGILRVYREVV
jgi:glycosyltransferase involved in cell wall biosynthesis